jgi:hypothetical protein
MRQLAELEQVVRLLIAEHGKLLAQLDQQQAAMRAFKVQPIEDLTALQETTRLRIATLDTKRRMLVQQIARMMRVELDARGELTLTRLAGMFPQRAKELRGLRDELKNVLLKIQSRTTISTRLAGTVLGHLNTAVRLLAGAVQQAGVYTKHGTPKVATRIGAMEAVG